MVKLEDIAVGSKLLGIDTQGAVSVVAVHWYGDAVLDVTYRNSRGEPGSRLL